MPNRKLFALQGEARGAARLSYEGSSGALAVELLPRGDGEYVAWLVHGAGALLRAPLGPAMTASLPANAKDASGVLVSRAGKIVASGFSGLTRAQMEAAALRVQLALAQESGPKPPAARQRAEEPVRAAEAAAVPEPEAVSPKPAQARPPQAQDQTQAQRERIVPASRAAQTLAASCASPRAPPPASGLPCTSGVDGIPSRRGGERGGERRFQGQGCQGQTWKPEFAPAWLSPGPRHTREGSARRPTGRRPSGWRASF
ncbi:MAG TPA: hypothetical protein PK438_03935, partial [Clostridia bacterium]|nr:hypothetical protein [Clostridia bacterium]